VLWSRTWQWGGGVRGHGRGGGDGGGDVEDVVGDTFEWSRSMMMMMIITKKYC